MGRKIDFNITHDFKNEPLHKLSHKIIHGAIVNRLKAKKPCIVFISGDSGEGKTYASARLQQAILETQGLNYRDYIDDINVFSPIEYPEKIKALLNDKRLKKVNTIAIQEARDIVRSKQWYDFLVQAVGDINAMSRAIKPLCIIIVSQFIRDITNDIRYTLNYYIKVSRPTVRYANSKLHWYVIYKDDYDIEKPRLRTRRLAGRIKDQDGNVRLLIPSYIELLKPEKDICERIDDLDFSAKKKVLKRKLDKLLDEIRKDIGEGNNRVDAMVEHYSKNLENIHQIGKVTKKGFKTTPKTRELHAITKEDADIFEKRLYQVLKDKGVIENES